MHRQSLRSHAPTLDELENTVLDQSFGMTWISHITGNLYQGGVRGDGAIVLPEGFAVVVNLAGVESYDLNYHPPEVSIVVDMMDSVDQPVSVIEPWIERIAHYQDRPILIHCQYGLNRSGYLVARTLMHRGMSAQAAIELVRDKRHPEALFNQHFVQELLARDNPHAP